MKYISIWMTALSLMAMAVPAEELVLKAAKDTFCRSNERNNNNGASPQLVVVHLPISRAIVGFDLTGITNEIIKAEFQFRQQNTMPDNAAIDLVIAPMATAESNFDWQEGGGNVGTMGRLARPGECSFAWCSFRDVPWMSDSGKKLGLMSDSGLWKSPVATLRKLKWTEGEWVKVPLNNLSLLEKIRASDKPIFTLGMWGTAGNGFYFIGSKESGHAAKLVLELKVEEEQP